MLVRVVVLLLFSLACLGSLLLSLAATASISVLGVGGARLVETMLTDAVPRLALALASMLSLVVRELVAVVEDAVAGRMLLGSLVRRLRTLRVF